LKEGLKEGFKERLKEGFKEGFKERFKERFPLGFSNRHTTLRDTHTQRWWGGGLWSSSPCNTMVLVPVQHCNIHYGLLRRATTSFVDVTTRPCCVAKRHISDTPMPPCPSDANKVASAAPNPPPTPNTPGLSAADAPPPSTACVKRMSCSAIAYDMHGRKRGGGRGRGRGMVSHEGKSVDAKRCDYKQTHTHTDTEHTHTHTHTHTLHAGTPCTH
jgi:hypothetical protein